MKFDLVSDLHLSDPGIIDSWVVQSPVCVVAGDVSSDRQLLPHILQRLSDRYESVLYIDGNDEHRYTLGDLDDSYRSLYETIGTVRGVTSLYDNIAVINDVAFIGANGWWTFDVQGHEPDNNACEQMCRHYNTDLGVCDRIIMAALHDTRYLANSVRRLQLYPDIRRVVIVTHTVPDFSLIAHDQDITENYRRHTTTNPWMRMVLDEDTEKKIHTWCFGHYHRACDYQMTSGRYVSNPRGRENTPWFCGNYQPQIIEI